jgi:hypothetical protein
MAGRYLVTVSLGITGGGIGGSSRRIIGGGFSRSAARSFMTSVGGGAGCGGRSSRIMSG